jgi:hypothetical protein
MQPFTFLWAYFAISLTVSVIFFVLYYLLEKYGDRIKRSEVAKAVVSKLLYAASLTCLWYSISTTLTIFNKWFMTIWDGGFKFPLFATCIHMVSK